MAEYYLISQLPSLDGISENAPLPITEERFTELCNRFLGKRSQEAMNKLTLSPPKSSESSGSVLIDAWNESERNLRFALGKVRAEKMKKTFDTENRIFPVEYVKAASAATEIENPMEAEKYLSSYRLEILETLRPMDLLGAAGYQLRKTPKERAYQYLIDAAYNNTVHECNIFLKKSGMPPLTNL